VKTWETIAAIFAGVALAGVTIWALTPKSVGTAAVGAPIVDQRNQLPIDPNAAAIFGNTYSARSKWSSDAMGN
jgi:hypothetical protein